MPRQMLGLGTIKLQTIVPIGYLGLDERNAWYDVETMYRRIVMNLRSRNLYPLDRYPRSEISQHERRLQTVLKSHW